MSPTRLREEPIPFIAFDGREFKNTRHLGELHYNHLYTARDDPFVAYPYQIGPASQYLDPFRQNFWDFETHGILSFPSWIDVIVVILLIIRCIFTYHRASMAKDDVARYLFYKTQDSWAALWLYGLRLTASELSIVEDIWLKYRDYVINIEKRTISEAEIIYQNFIIVWQLVRRIFPWKTHDEVTKLAMRYWPKYILFKSTSYLYSIPVLGFIVRSKFIRLIKADFTKEELTPPADWRWYNVPTSTQTETKE
jgi:hypothetical protein